MVVPTGKSSLAACKGKPNTVFRGERDLLQSGHTRRDRRLAQICHPQLRVEQVFYKHRGWERAGTLIVTQEE